MLDSWQFFIKRKQLFTVGQSIVFWISVTVFLIFYLFIVGSATYDDIYYQWYLNRYDLDKDGFFGGNEITKEQQAAIKRLTNDVGRNFACITGLIYSFLISVMVYLFGRIGILRRVSKVRADL